MTVAYEPWTPSGLKESDPRAGELWRHYKGIVYRVVGYAFDQERAVLLVLYQPADWPAHRVVYARDPREFAEFVPVAGGPRFRRVEPDGDADLD